ncbi:hypothetical protein, partial [Arthrobacter sp.]|uniref:hypothetical protein n=1 Tax=Arthrobacter sp. TaxID=1667 RepID=UPI0025903942
MALSMGEVIVCPVTSAPPAAGTRAVLPSGLPGSFRADLFGADCFGADCFGANCFPGPAAASSLDFPAIAPVYKAVPTFIQFILRNYTCAYRL